MAVPKHAPVQIRMKRYCFKHISDNLHDRDEPNLVRSFEKQEGDEVSHSDSLHDLHDPNLMQPSQFNTGETLQDCIDFDELLNDVHSTAASAQLLRFSLSGSSEPTR